MLKEKRKYNKRPKPLSKVKFTSDYRWDLAFEAIKELTGVNPNAIRRASRVTPLPAARMILARLMYRDLYMSPEYIALQMNKDRTATYTMLKAIEEYKKEEPYKSYYQAFEDLFYKKIKDLGYVCPCCGALEPVMKGDKPLKPNRDESI